MVNVAYTCNRCLTVAMVSKTPKEVWSDTRPYISHMRVLRCIAYAKVPNKKCTKLEFMAIKCLFLGYCVGIRVYGVMFLKTRKIIKNCGVTFIEEKDNIE